MSIVMGVGLGLFCGYAGGRVDSLIMRIADIQLPSGDLVALLISGIGRQFVPASCRMRWRFM